MLGIGQLAAAVRVELVRRGLAAVGPSLVVACSDFENPLAYLEMSRRTCEDRAPLLFACLQGSAREQAARLVERIAQAR